MLEWFLVMEITFLGHASFRLRLPRGITLVTDPFGKLNKNLMRLVKADILTISHEDPNHFSMERIEGKPFVVKDPGEYEIAGVRVTAFCGFHDKEKGKKLGRNNIFLIEMEEIKIGHLGDLGEVPSDKILEELSNVNVLLLPASGEGVISPSEAAKLVSDLEPEIVIPTGHPGLDMDPANFQSFLKNLEVENPVREKKLVLKKDQLPEETKIILLERF